MPSADAVYTRCEDYEPHEGHPMGGDEFCIGVSAPDGSTESLLKTLEKIDRILEAHTVETFEQRYSRIMRDHNVSKQDAVRIAKSEINIEEAVRRARKRSSLQADNKRQLGADR